MFRKEHRGAPPGFFAVEAAGLHWLADAPGGVATVRPVEVGEDHITMPRLAQVPPTARQAAVFGRRLAATHAAGAERFGVPPGTWTGHGFIGNAPMPHDLSADVTARGGAPLPWGRFYARLRIAPFVRAARDRDALDTADAAAIDRVCTRLEDGDESLTGPPEAPSRLHGDLWSGNVLMTAEGAVLIDPAAHGGHRETDLAMLALFGAPHLDVVTAAYAEASPLAPGWADRVPLHQLHPLLVHATLFGGGYGPRAAAVARRL